MGSTTSPVGSALAPIKNQVNGVQNIGGDQIFNVASGEPLTGKACLKSLAFPQMLDRSNGIDIPTGGTCEWILQHKEWKRWMSSDRGLLWMKGMPGSGKSTLLRYTLGNLKETKAGKGALVLSFFFHGRGDDLQRNPLGLFRSLLHQVLEEEPGALSQLVATFEQRRDGTSEPGGKWEWKLDELRKFLQWSVLDVLKRRQVWIFVDALDEAGDENAKDVIDSFNSLLGGPASRSQLRICFACRHYPIQDWGSGFEIWVERENSRDILTYLQAHLATFTGRTTPPLPELINQRANGIFIWARLVVERVRALVLGEDMAETERKIKETIDSVPQGLDEFYLEIVQGIENTTHALRLMQWVRCAWRPLSLDELRWAMVVGTEGPGKSLEGYKSLPGYTEDNAVMERRVKTLSRGLVEIVPSSDTRIAQFIHQSAKDFFDDKGLVALSGKTGSTQVNADSAAGIAHYQVSRACVRYLAMKKIRLIQNPGGDTSRHDFPLLEYATKGWIHHAQMSEAKKICQKDLLHDLHWPSEHVVEQWARIFQLIDPFSPDCPPTGINLVHAVSRYGLMTLLQMIVEQMDQAGINARDSYGRTPLVYAAERGHTAVSKILLDNNADVNARDWIGESYVPRETITTYHSFKAAVYDGRTPLVHAEKRGRKAGAKVLLQDRINARDQDQNGASPLHWAAIGGHTETVSLLLKNGSDTKAKSKGGCTPLDWAINRGVQPTVKVLLETELWLDYEYMLPHQYFPLYPSVGSGFQIYRSEYFGMDGPGPPCFWMPELGPSWVWMLADHPSWWIERISRVHKYPVIGHLSPGGYGIGFQSACGHRTPLLRAVELGERSIVSMLLAKGALPGLIGSHGWSPLLLAKEKRDEALVKLLKAYQASSAA